MFASRVCKVPLSGKVPLFTCSRIRRRSHLFSASRRDYSNGSAGEVSAVVIGGGPVGCSIAYHLAKHGMKNVVLLESKTVASGAERYPPGFVSYSHSVPSFRHALAYSVELYSQLLQHNGEKLPFHRPGTIRLAGTPQRVEEFTTYLAKDWMGAQDNRTRLLTPLELQKICPLLNIDRVLAALYTEGDGFLDPVSLTEALAFTAKQSGAVFYENTPHEVIKQRSDGLWDVKTNNGTLTAINIINASGLGAKETAALVGIDLPLININHHYYVTEANEGLDDDSHQKVPAIIDHENGWYLRPYQRSLLFGAFESPNRVCLSDDKKVPKENFDGIEAQYKAACEVVPSLGWTGIRDRQSGVHSLTPDGLPLIGPVQGLNNYWLACGFFDGVATGGGVGKYIAEWILEGEPPFDLVEADANRFDGWIDQRFLKERAKESYSMTLNWSQSPAERTGGRPSSRVSGLYGALLEQDAHMEYRGGWEVPAWFDVEDEEKFGTLAREYQLVTNKCGIIDLSHKGMVEVRGSDGSRFLNYLLSAEAPEFQVIHHDRHFVLVCQPEQEARNLRWLEKVMSEGNFHVELIVVSSYLACIGVVGPTSEEVLSEMTKEDVSLESFPMGATKVLRLAGVPVILVRHSETGEDGWEAYHSRADSLKLYDGIMARGERHGIVNFGTETFNTLRIEKGLRSDGSETSLDLSPYEAGVESLVDMKKSDFIGKAALKDVMSKMHEQEWKIVLCQLDPCESEGDASKVAKGGELVRLEGSDQICGEVTSGCYSFHTQSPVCFAKIKRTVLVDKILPSVTVDLGSERRRTQILSQPPAHVVDGTQ